MWTFVKVCLLVLYLVKVYVISVVEYFSIMRGSRK